MIMEMSSRIVQRMLRDLGLSLRTLPLPAKVHVTKDWCAKNLGP